MLWELTSMIPWIMGPIEHSTLEDKSTSQPPPPTPPDASVTKRKSGAKFNLRLCKLLPNDLGSFQTSIIMNFHHAISLLHLTVSVE